MEQQYLIIPTYDTVILPDVDYQLNIHGLSSEEISRIKIDNNKAILLPMKEMKDRDQLTINDFFGLGVLADILEVEDTPQGTRVHAQTREKILVTEISNNGAIIDGGFEVHEEYSDITVKGEQELLDSLKKTAGESTQYFQGGEMAKTYIDNIKSINEFGAMFGQFLDLSNEEKYHLLETDSLKERGLMLKDALMRFLGTIEMQADLNNKYNDTEGASYKRAAIQKQIGLLQEALDDMDPESASVEDSYKKKIEASGMPEECRKEVDRVLKRYMESQLNDPERNSMENYLDFVTELKWKPDELPDIDLDHAKKILDKDHYGLEKVKERILQQIAVMKLKNKNTGTILLLVGAPGTGKTSLGKSVAEALGRKYVRISLGGIRDEAEIRGHRRTYVGAMPGRIMDGIKRSGAMNPVVVLDEVDKITQGGFEGDPSSALLEVLDPEQNNTFVDHYMNIPYDLSNVFFICTANDASTIPQPLLDRMEVIQLPGYSPIEKEQIAKRHLLPRAMKDAGIDKKNLKVSIGAIRKIVSEYTMEAGVRGLKKQLDVLCRHAAADIVREMEGDNKKKNKKAAAEGEGAETKVAGGTKDKIVRTLPDGTIQLVVTEDNLSKYLGNHIITHDRVQKKNPAGIVTGLAWTQAGGEILFIESTAMKGNGQIQLTGQLGDVMKESASIAYSLLKSYYINDDTMNFDDKNIHIHVPEGAVPKDGPSAGVTMFTALTSLVTGIPAPADLAMTGEISLRGQVLPIGGLPEKLMAAERAGVKKVLIPKDNVRDLDDVAEEVLKHLTIVPVENVREVIREALGIELPKNTHPDFHEKKESKDKKEKKED
jgi:ATP-dependent Lon protease